MKFLVFLLSIALLFKVTKSEKILVVSFFASKSHRLTYDPLLTELAKRGHQITVLSPIKSTKEIKNITEIFTTDLSKTSFALWNPFDLKEKNNQKLVFLLGDFFAEICKPTYDLPHVKAFLNETFDLIFMQPLLNECALGFVYRLKAPLVLFTPFSVPSFIASQVGGHFPTSFVSHPYLGYPDEMDFVQRFYNFGYSLYVEGILRFYYEPLMTSFYREKLGDDLPSVRDIISNASLVLSNGHFSINRPKPYLPDVIDVGGIHSRPAKALPEDIEEFISQSDQDGFIYFSMGSIIQGDKLPDEKRKMFLRVFSKLKQQVLWKWESETMPDLPKNVKLSKWLPQQDLLGHPNIKMFITHCGGGSTEEAIYHGVPLVGLPIFADQPLNALMAKNHGLIIDLGWEDLTEEQLLNAINEILINPKYRDNAKKLSKIFRDQPETPLERGVFWIEYVLRHKGAPHLRSSSRKLNFFEYHSVDVIIAYLLIICVSLAILYRTIGFILRILIKSPQTIDSN